MKININGITRDMTPEEEEAYRREQAEQEARERQRPATDLEKLQAQSMYTALMTDTLIEDGN